ncbi:MAG: hypothetical protein GY751_10525 [Bacteroidetes bacterium]|nr:hypothetical protein [Bacteroidota bacterium]
MPRSRNYSPSRHGTGWSGSKPGNAAVNFLNNPNVAVDAKIEYIRNNGATPPTSMLEQADNPIVEGNTPATDPAFRQNPVIPDPMAQEEEPESLRGQTTTHYLINFCATGFGYNLRRRLSETSEIQRVRQEYRQGS